MSQPATRNNARRDFYERIGGLSMAPLWESLHQLVPPQPAPKYQAAHWDYDKVRPYLMESGSLITARCSIEAGREVFAIPGSIHSPQSRGCHALIKHGAKLVDDARDVLEELRWAPQSELALDAPAPNNGAATSDALIVALGFEPVSIDQLQARTGWPTAQLSARLLELELQGLVARLPGGRYQRSAAA